MQYVVAYYDAEEVYGPFNSTEEADAARRQASTIDGEFDKYVYQDMGVYTLSKTVEEADQNRKRQRIEYLEKELQQARNELLSPVSSGPRS